MKLVVVNQTSYSDDDVLDAVEFASEGFEVPGTTLVVVKHTGHSYYREVPYSGFAFYRDARRARAWARRFYPSATWVTVLRVGRASAFPMAYPSTRRGTFNGEWPEFQHETWQEALVAIAAHEYKHLEDYSLDRRTSELPCEKIARKVLDRFISTDYGRDNTATSLGRATEGRAKMATTETKIETTTNHVRNANADEEKILVEKVAPLFTDESTKLAALRYGRKMLRFQAGARTSAPPIGALSQAQAATVAKALGIELKTKKAPAKAKAAKSSDGSDVKPDPKPERKSRSSKTKTAA